MSLMACRDCGMMIPAAARGCPKCARNLEAERAVEKILRVIIVLIILILAGVLSVLLAYRNR